MGLNKSNLPDSILARIPSRERRALGLRAPVAEIISKRKRSQELRRERELQTQIENWLRLHCITTIRARMDRATTNNPGTPDFLFAIKGQAVALEAKLPGRVPSIEQLKMLTALSSNGWICRVVHSIDEAIQAVRLADQTANQSTTS